MDFIEIGEARYASEDLSSVAANNLFELGISGINSIDIHAPSNCISIGFDNIEDAELTHAIARSGSRPVSKDFKSNDALGFLYELNSVFNSWEGDQ